MRTRSGYVVEISGWIVAVAVTGLALMPAVVLASATDAGEVESRLSYDGLERVETSKVSKAYIDPEADFSVFKRVKILKPHVAFKSNWQRDQNRQRTRRVTAKDMERIKADVAALFEKVFTETLEADGGFEVVNEIGDDVLLLRPAIIDLDISVPDTQSSGRSRMLSTSAGAATLYIELFDSVSGHIIGRAADRRAIRGAGNSIGWSNRAMNAAEARRVFKSWAELLRSFLEQHYTK